MKKKLITMILIVCFCVSCGGSGSSGEIKSDDNQTITSLIPLNISTTDIDDNPIPYIDVGLIGSHVLYKLKFTNPNVVAVTVPSTHLPFDTQMHNYGTFLDQNWLYSQAGVESASSVDELMGNYSVVYNPGINTISIYFNKTVNVDDCFNVKSIPPGGSCSFYAYAYNLGLSYTTGPTIYNYPLAYFIKSSDDKNSLLVQQCRYSHSASTDSVVYDCANESKSDHANQFISYKMNSVNMGTTNIPVDTFLYTGSPAISYDGNWLYRCRQVIESRALLSDTICDKYAMIYENNILTQASQPTETVVMDNQIGGAETIQEVYPELDGSSSWVSMHDKLDGYSLDYTKVPHQPFWAYCFNNTPCAPNIDTTVFTTLSPGIVGLDGSFWWNTQENADVYVPALGTFVQTNIPGVGGVDATGVVINDESCYRTSASLAVYIEQKLINYVPPYYGPQFMAVNNYVYLRMQVLGLVDVFGDPVKPLDAYFRVHTESGLCEVQLDDYSINTPFTNEKYSLHALSYAHNSSNFVVMPESNIYFGR